MRGVVRVCESSKPGTGHRPPRIHVAALPVPAASARGGQICLGVITLLRASARRAKLGYYALDYDFVLFHAADCHCRQDSYRCLDKNVAMPSADTPGGKRVRRSSGFGRQRLRRIGSLPHPNAPSPTATGISKRRTDFVDYSPAYVLPSASSRFCRFTAVTLRSL